MCVLKTAREQNHLLVSVSHDMNRRATVLILFALLALHRGVPVQGQSALNGHTVKLDSQNKLLAWTSDQANAYDQVLSLSTNYLLTGVPRGPGGLQILLRLQLRGSGHPSPAGNGWPHNPAGLYAMLTDSGTAYYAYSGNVAMMNLVRDVLTYQLDHGMTPATWAWPGVAFASGDGGSLTYQGAHYGDSTGSGDGFGVIQPDKVAEVGVAFLQYCQVQRHDAVS